MKFIRTLLTIKHWQLVVLIVLPNMFNYGATLAEIVNFTTGLTLLGWIYAIGFYGHEKIILMNLKPMNFRLFQINTFLLPVFMIITGRIVPSRSDLFTITDIAGPILGVYTALAFFQLLFFISKTIAKLENRREGSLDDYFKYLMLVLVLPLGIWSLQPRINRFFEEIEPAV